MQTPNFYQSYRSFQDYKIWLFQSIKVNKYNAVINQIYFWGKIYIFLLKKLWKREKYLFFQTEKLAVTLNTGIWPMNLNFPVFATGVRIFRSSNDVGPLFVGPGSTRILEKKTQGKKQNGGVLLNFLLLSISLISDSCFFPLVFVCSHDPQIEALHRY